MKNEERREFGPRGSTGIPSRIDSTTTTKRLHISAQGCCEVAKSGKHALAQRSRCAVTPGSLAQTLRGCCLLVILASLSAVAFGQASSPASIHGTIADELSAKVASAEVRLKSRAGTQLSTATDERGIFEFANLLPGEYLIEVKADGFSGFSSDEVVLEPGESKHVQFRLKVAGISESVVVVATGTPQRADEVSKVVSILDSKQIEARRELTLPEALRGTAGVRVQQQGSPGALTSIRLRGQRTSDTAVLFDGLRVRDAGDISGSAASLITDLVPVAIERVEILRGAGSSLYGTNAIGGVVNFVPETSLGGVHFEFGAEAGGLKTFREHVKVASGNNRFGFNLGLNRLDVRHGVDGQDEYGNSAGGGRFQFNPTSSIMIAANLYGTISNMRLNDSPFALPAAFGSGNFPRAVAGFTFQPDFNNPDQGRRNRLLAGSVRLSQQIDERFSYSVAYQRVSSDRRNYNGSQIDPRFMSFYPFGDFEFVNVNKGNTNTLDARLHARFGRSNLATVGFEFEDESIFQESIPSFSFFNNTTDKQRTFALFVQDQLSFFDERLQISLGVRGQFFRIRAADRPGSLSQISGENSVTGDGAVAYLFRSTNTKLRAHVGNGFRAPSLFERFGAGAFQNVGFVRFGDPTLRAEHSISLDAGVDQRVARDRVLLGATWFYTHLKRVIAFEPSFVADPLGAGRFSGYVNRPGGLSRGFESFVETTPVGSLEIRASYTYTNSDRSIPSRGLQPEYVIPKHLFGLTLNQRYRAFALSFDLNRTGSHIAPIFENDFPFRTAELTFSGYTKADLFGSYAKKLSERWTAVLFGGADNIFNQRYFENGFLAPRIVGRGGVSLKF